MTPLNFQQGLVQPPVEQKWSKRISVQCRDPISTPNFLGTLHFHKDMAANERRQQNIRQSKGIISSSWGSISIRFFVFFPHLLIYLLRCLLLFQVWVVPKIFNLKSETCSSWITRTHGNQENVGALREYWWVSIKQSSAVNSWNWDFDMVAAYSEIDVAPGIAVIFFLIFFSKINKHTPRFIPYSRVGTL